MPAAKFTGDFAEFYDAVAKADSVIKDFGDGAERVGGQLNRMANEFSGRKVVQDATIMAKAIEDIGGVSRLTEKELIKVGDQAANAVAKMKALGMDVPANLQAIADAATAASEKTKALGTDAPVNIAKVATETKKANDSSMDWIGTLTKLASAVGIAFSVQGVITWVGSMLDAADAVKDLSVAWGVSTDTAQKFSQAAKLTGTTADAVGSSLMFVSRELGENSDRYRAMVENLGLSFDTLRKGDPETAFRAIVQAIADIKDPLLQADLAAQVFGNSWKQFLPAVRDGFLEVADAQKVMSEETVRGFSDAKQEWESFKQSVSNGSTEMAGGMVRDVKQITSSWSNFFAYWGRGIADSFLNTSYVDTWLDQQRDMQRAAKQTGKDIELFISYGPPYDASMRSSAQVLAELKRKEDAARVAQSAREKAQADLKREQDAYNKSIRDLQGAWSGGTAVDKAILYLDAMRSSVPVQQMTRAAQDDINKVMGAALDVYTTFGDKAPQAMYDVWFQTLKTLEPTEALTGAIKGLKAEYADNWEPPKVRPGGIAEILGIPSDLGSQLPGLIGAGGMAPPGVFDGLAKGLVSNLSASILRAIEGGGDILKAAGSSIGSYMLDPKLSNLGKTIESAASKLPGLLGSAISGAIPVVGALIGPAVSWLGGKIANLFGKKEHDKLRDSFVSAAGGIDELNKAAHAAGMELDDLLKARSVDQVKAAMTELEGAFALQATAYDAAIDAAKRYGFTLEELGPAMARQELDKQAQQLYKDWEILNAAGLDTINITGRMSDAVSLYVQQASAMGTEVPNAMKPMLESFVAAGKLVDANGVSITNLEDAGISFSMTMSEGFKALIDKVGALTDAISRSLGLAIKNVPPVQVKGSVTWDVAPVPTPKKSNTGVDLESYQEGTEGFRDFGAGTPVMLHGWEAVVPYDESNPAASFATLRGGAAPAAAAGGLTQVVINAQGAFFDTPESLQRLADKVSNALTARYGVMQKLRAAS